MKFLKLSFLIPLIAFLLLFSEEVKATHIIGGEINYKCLGNDQFEVSLTVYRDCFYGVPFFDNPASVGFFDQNNNLVHSVGTNGQLRMFVRNNDTLSPILEGRCIVVPPDVCVHTTTYKDTIELPYLEGGYFLSYQRCCRNETILNIIDPDAAGASFTAKISEKALLECNNSATFNEWPPIYICVNEPIEFDHSATDVDGDSLVYKLCEPLMGVFPNQPRPWPPNAPPYPPVNWNEPGFSFDNKLGGSDPLKIDYQTGLLTGTPTIIGQFVVGVCVEEYRDGELISTTNRDFQYNVGECHTTTAAFFTAESYCDQLEVSFENLSEGSFGEIWYFGGIDNPIDSSFQSDPIFTFPEFGTYDVTLIALGLDTECNDTITKQITLLDVEMEPLINIEVGECTDTVSLTLGVEVLSDSLSDFTYLWEVEWGDRKVSSSDSLFEIRVSGADSIYVSLRVISTELGCWRTVDFRFPTGLILEDGKMFSYLVCKRDTFGLLPDADTSLNYIWSPENFIIGPSDIPNPTVSPEAKTLYTAQLSNEFCTGEISVLVDVVESDFFTAESFCDQLEVSFENLSENSFGEKWYFGGIDNPIDSSLQSDPTFTFPDFGIYDVTLVVLGLEGECRDTITKQIRLLDIGIEPLINVEVGECTDTVSLTLGVEVLSDSLSDFTYHWKVEWGDQEVSSTDSMFEIRVFGVDSIHISLRVISTELGCWRTVELKYPTGLYLEEDPMFYYFVCKRDTFELLPGADTTLNYIWSPESSIIGPSDIPNPLVSPTEETLYTAQISNEFCPGEISVLVDVFESDFFTAESYCDQLEVSFENISENSIGQIWYFGGIDNPIDSSFQSDPTFIFPDFGTYDVTMVALGFEGECYDTITKQIRLLEIGLEPLINVEVGECTDMVTLTLGVEVLSDSLSDFTYHWKVEWAGQELISTDSLFEISVSGVDSIHISLRVISTELGCWRTVDLKYPTGLILEDGQMFTNFVCIRDTIGLFPDADTSLNYIWSPETSIIGPFDIPNPTISLEEETLFTAQVSGEFCTGEISVLVGVVESKFFTAESYCDQLEVSFENLSENSFGEIWYFGGIDNPIDSSFQSDPTFTFPDFGTYDVTLVVLGLEGECYDTITKQIRLLDIGMEPLINVDVGECTDTVSLTLGVEVLSDSLSDFTYLWQVEWGNQKVSSSDSLFEIRVSGVDSIHISLRVISTELGCWRTVDLKYPTGLIFEEGLIFTNFLCNRDTIGLLPDADTSLNYNWSPANLIIGPSDIPNPTISPNEETLYTAQISNEFCTGEVSVLVGVFDSENDRIVPDTICGSLTVTFDYNPFAGFANHTHWRFETDSTVQSTVGDFPTYTFPVYGDYTIRIAPLGFNYDNCPRFVFQDLYIFDWDFDLDLNVERELCNLNLSVISSEGNIPGSHEFQWVVNGDTLLITGPEFEYEYTESESLLISVSVLNAYGCTVTKDTLIYTGIIPGSTVIDSFLICKGDSLQLEVPFSPDYVYQWKPDKYFLTDSDIHNPLVAPESNIIYSVDISNQLCTEIYFVEVEVRFSEFDLPRWVICDLLNPVFEVDSLPGVNYHWIFGDLNNPLAESTDINPQIEFDDYGFYPVTLILHDTVSGCRDTLKSEVQLINSELWSVSIEVNRNECEFNNVQLGLGALLEGELPDGDFTFDWKITGDTVINLSGDSIELDLTGVEFLEIELTVTDSFGCSHTQTIVFNYAIFEIAERDTLSMCIGDTVFLNPDFHPDFDYVWSPATGLLDGITHSNPSASPTATTLYTANIFNGSCTGQKEVLVIVNENPVIVSLSADPATVLPERESMLFAEVQPPGATILWSPAESLDDPNIHNPLATPLETTTYVITVTSEEGCTTVDSITVFIQDLPCEIPYVFLPNAFSPNGDGMNDVLYLLGDHIERFVLIIYNRWGQEVFRTVELDKGWNGQFRGEDLPPDVYGYYLEVECIGGAHFSEKGNVSLIR